MVRPPPPDEAADAAVVEVGLGGRLDATNVVHGAVNVLTSVGFDHQEYLGGTLEEIAGEKLAIVDEGSTLVTGPLQPEVEAVVRRIVPERSVNWLAYGRDFVVEGTVPAVGGWSVDISGTMGEYEDIHLPVHGRHQTLNFAVSVAAAESLIGHELDGQAVMEGASVLTLPGRMEPVEGTPPFLLDGAHNPQGFGALASSLAEEFPSVEWVLVTGVMKDKTPEEMLPMIQDRLKAVVVTSVDSESAMDVATLRRRLEGLDTPIEVRESVPEALEYARTLAGSDGRVLVAGSLYLVGAARAALAGGAPTHRNER